jgi:hypothetical protein
VNEKTEATISIIAALFVLISAMFDPKTSVGLAIAFLVILAGYKFTRSSRKNTT